MQHHLFIRVCDKLKAKNYLILMVYQYLRISHNVSSNREQLLENFSYKMVSNILEKGELSPLGDPTSVSYMCNGDD